MVMMVVAEQVEAAAVLMAVAKQVEAAAVLMAEAMEASVEAMAGVEVRAVVHLEAVVAEEGMVVAPKAAEAVGDLVMVVVMMGVVPTAVTEVMGRVMVVGWLEERTVD